MRLWRTPGRGRFASTLQGRPLPTAARLSGSCAGPTACSSGSAPRRLCRSGRPRLMHGVMRGCC
eukprot:13425338-Alexandrium_andersonii.AAC.1